MERARALPAGQPTTQQLVSLKSRTDGQAKILGRAGERVAALTSRTSFWQSTSPPLFTSDLRMRVAEAAKTEQHNHWLALIRQNFVDWTSATRGIGKCVGRSLGRQCAALVRSRPLGSQRRRPKRRRSRQRGSWGSARDTSEARELFPGSGANPAAHSAATSRLPSAGASVTLALEVAEEPREAPLRAELGWHGWRRILEICLYL